MALITLFGFGSLGLVIIKVFHSFEIADVFTFGENWPNQVLRGGLFGVSAVACIIWLIEIPFLQEPKQFFRDLLTDAGLKLPDLIFLSMAAGIGEEILFRGAMQPFIGIWPTAIIFVALHGYLNPFNIKMSVYGVLMVIVSAGLGYLFEYVGIYAAIFAHFLIDIVLFIRFMYIK